MGRSFFWITLVAILLLVLLFFPIVFHSSAHFDVNRKKFAFSVRLYGNIKLIGGYITTYKGGVALHISQKKAILIPYKEMNNERKKFSFFNPFFISDASFRIYVYNYTIIEIKVNVS
jgi:hypothetical protein